MSGQTTSYGQQPYGEQGLTAMGTNQASALLLPSQINIFTNVAPGSGCRSPAIPSTLTVINNDMADSNVLSWYPPSGDQIQGLAINQALQIPAGTQATLVWFGSALDPAPRVWVRVASTSFLNGGTIPVTPGPTPLIINGNSAVPAAFVNSTALEIVGAPGGNARVTIDTFGGVPSFTGRRATGTVPAPTAVQAGQAIAGFGSFGYAVTGYSTASRSNWNNFAAENWTDTAQGTYQTWSVTATGGTVTAEAMRLQDSGILTIGATAASGTAKLQVTGGTSTDTLAVSGNAGFFGTAATTKPTVTGSKGANAALTSLMTALAGLGLVVDSTS